MLGRKVPWQQGQEPKLLHAVARSRSRLPAMGVSTVNTSAEQPARRARLMAPSAAWRPPSRYKLVPERAGGGGLHIL